MRTLSTGSKCSKDIIVLWNICGNVKRKFFHYVVICHVNVTDTHTESVFLHVFFLCNSVNKQFPVNMSVLPLETQNLTW